MLSSSRSKFLSPEVLEQGAREVGEIAVAEGIRLGIVGGYALQFFGSPRLTGDLDVIADRVPKGMRELSRLTFGGIRTETSGGVPTDIIIRDDDYASLYAEALDYVLTDAVLPAPIVPIEYIAAMKLATRRDKDILDVEWSIVDAVMDLAWARRIIAKHLGVYAAKEFEREVELARWKRSTGKL